MERSIAWDGITTGDAGPYSSADWALLWKYLIGTGASRPNVGPFLNSGTTPNNGLRVQAQSPAAAAVDVLAGSAIVAGRFYLSDATEALTIAANSSGNPRIDTIVLRADYSLQTVVQAVLQGTPAVSPTPPNLTQTIGTLYEIPLADVAVANGFATIAQTDITPRSEWANAPSGTFVTVLNNSGGTLTDGQVVIWDTSADRAVTTTTTYNHARIAGVIRGRVSNGGYALMQTEGIGYVKVDAAYARGTGLYTSTTAGSAGGVTGIQNGTLGMLMEASTGAGEFKLAMLSVQRRKNAIARYSQTLAQGTAGTAYSSGNNTVILNTEDTDNDNIGALASNQVTLQPGLYHVTGNISVAANALRQARVSIYDATAAAAVIQGVNFSVPSGQTVWANVAGHLLVSAPTLYELRILMSAASVSQPAAVSSGSEVYATLEFVRIDQ